MANEIEGEKGSALEPHPEGQSGDAKVTGPYAILLPPDMGIWNEARRLVADKNIRVEDLATCASQDPVIVIELLRISNAMYFAGGRSPITSTRTAIVRLGSDIVLEALEKMSDRTQFDNEDVSHWFEIHRSRGRRTAIVARILAEALARTLADDCQAVGLITPVGEMLAVANFREKYVELAEELSRSGINYRLSQDYKFDVERMGITYLRRNGIPEALLFALDRDARSRTPDRAIMKPLCSAATEMVEAFDANRWEKIAPGKNLPPKSSLRMLQLAEAQYLKIYERASEYLFSARLQEEKRKQDAAIGLTEPGPSTSGLDQDTLQSEILGILEAGAMEDFDAPIEEEVLTIPAEIETPPQKPKTEIRTVEAPMEVKLEQFGLKPERQKQKTAARLPRSEPVKQVPVIKTSSAATRTVSNITNMFEKAQTAEELLTGLLKMLVDTGPFEKSAIIVVSQDRKHAIVVAARGPNIGSGQKIAINDPLSPLAQCFSKVQSFGKQKSAVSPFGSNTFAIAPIDADHDTPVALYADCGNSGSITFEARRVFRTVIDILNKKLPSLPGGIPVEV